MTIQVDRTRRFGPGETITITDNIGVDVLQAPSGQPPISFSNAGSILLNSSSPFIVTGVSFGYGGFFEGAVFTNEATGVFRITSTGGANPTYGIEGIAGWNGDVVNAGLFEIIAVGDAVGVMTQDPTFAFTNSGHFLVTSDEDAWGILAQNGATVLNSGELTVTGRVAVGIRTDLASAIRNDGTIHALATSSEGWSIGVDMSNSGLTTSSLINTGRIEAQYAIVDATNWSPPQDAVQTVTNSGEIVGIVDLARGDDVLNNSGSIRGEVWMGYGADAYDGRGGSQIGAVHGEFGDDALTGGDGADALYGEDGNDRVTGGGGDDVLQGGRGDNLIEGGAGIDTLTYAALTIAAVVDLAAGTGDAAGHDVIQGVENVYGGVWADRLSGDVGANLLFGADGNDILNGRGGADTLVGGLGADTLTGGAGPDTFRFGVGDGADVVTDLGADDRIVIHGYAAARELRQVGADTLVVLSDADSILLRNTLAASVGPDRLSFTPDARPAYATPGEAPLLLGESHVEIHERFVIHEGERIHFDGALGTLAVAGRDTDTDPGVTNAGWINVTSSTPNAGPVGVGLSGYHAVDLTNLATGVIEVESTSGVAASGVIGQDFEVTVHNQGLIDVRANANAAGIHNQGFGMIVDNAGTIRVDGLDLVRGVHLGDGGSLTNSGRIEATGTGTVIGVGGTAFSEVVNTGSIVAHSSTGPSTGLYLRSTSFLISNTGVIQADRAIDSIFGSDRAVLTNSGQIYGEVFLGSGVDTVTNTGLMTGAVWLSTGDDLFDGSGGQQSGPVHGGEGRDHVAGGGGVDRLFGDEGSDTLTGGAGNDQLDGGASDDFVRFSGPRSAYAWTVSGDTITITGPDGVDTLVNVELLQFDDQLVSLTGYGVHDKGSGEDDVMTGTVLNDILDGGDVPVLWALQGLNDNGQDHLYGLGGDDVLSGGGRADTLDGGDGDDVVDGGEDNDVLLGGDGNDRLIGGKQADSIDGGRGVDTAVFAGARADYTITTTNGVTSVSHYETTMYNTDPQLVTDILSHVERLEFADQTVSLQAAPVIGTPGDDVLVGTSGDDVIEGEGGNDLVQGLGGNDVLNGGAGDDVVEGGDGDDRIGSPFDSGADRLDGGDGDDEIMIGGQIVSVQGGAGVDILETNAGGGAILHSFSATNGFELWGGGGANLNGTADVDVLDFSSLAAIAGVSRLIVDAGAGNDVLTGLGGTVGATLNGGAGDDLVTGLAGDDRLLGFIGDDVLRGGAGNDELDGYSDNDIMRGGAGADTLLGGDGVDTADYSTAAGGVVVDLASGQATDDGDGSSDTLSEIEIVIGSAQADHLGGGANADVLNGGGGADIISAAGGDDVLTGGAGNDAIDGGSGTDTAVFSGLRSAYTVSTAAGVTTVTGPDGTDSLTTVERLRFSDMTLIVGAGGGQYYAGTAGADSITGTAFNDQIDGGAGADILSGQGGDDVIDAGDGDDIVAGGAGDDVLNGGAGRDTLMGQAGDDVLSGGTGADLLYGGAGNDRYVVGVSGQSVIENLGEGTDTVETTLSSYTVSANVEGLVYAGAGAFTGTGNVLNNTIAGGAGADILSGLGGDDQIDAGAGNDTVAGGAGNDILRGGAGNDILIGQDGDDLLISGGGTDTLYGGVGNDRYLIEAAGQSIVENAGEGIDAVETTLSSFTLAANVENLTYLRTTAFTGTGNALNNIITGGIGADVLSGLAGDDQIDAGAGNDIVAGGAGNDILRGGAGNDTLIGQDGDDLLISGGGTDTLYGGVGNDRYLIEAAGQAIIENAGEGIDAVETTLSSFTLAANVENLTYLRTTAFTGTGNALNNIITGGIGDDVLRGGGGDDQLNGGLGQDRAVFTGLSTEYTVTAVSGGYLIVDSVAGRDGSTTVHGVETAQFSNISVILGGPAAPAEPQAQVIATLADDKAPTHDALVLPGLTPGEDDAFLLAMGADDALVLPPLAGDLGKDEGPLVLPGDPGHQTADGEPFALIADLRAAFLAENPHAFDHHGRLAHVIPSADVWG